MKKREQIEAELRTIIKNSKKNIFVKLTLTEQIENSRRMYLIYSAYLSGEKLKINNNDENILLLKYIDSDFKSLYSKIKKIPNPIKDLLDRKWEKDPNSKENIKGVTEIILKDLSNLHSNYKKIIHDLIRDFKNGTIENIDPAPIAIVHSAMTIWVEVLKNKYNLKNNMKLGKDLLVFLQQVFDVFACEADIKKSYYNWHVLKNLS